MTTPIEITPDLLSTVSRLLARYPGLNGDQIEALLDEKRPRTRRVDAILPRSWGEITAAVEAGWVTKNEARKYARLTQRRGPVRHREPKQVELAI